MAILDRKGLRQEKLKGLLEHWLGHATSADVREAAFTSLTAYQLDEDIDLLFESLMRQASPFCIALLIRYLVKIERPYGFQKLLVLALDPLDRIHEEAFRGIQRIAETEKIEILIQMLEQGGQPQRIFALKIFGEERKTRAVLSILRLLEEPLDAELKIAMIQALGRIGDARGFRALEKMVQEKDKKIREEAVYAIGRFASRLGRKFILSCLKDKNPQIRQTVFLAVFRLQDKKWEKIVASRLEIETDNDLKMILLPSVRALQSRRLFRVFLHMACSDDSLRIRMMSFSTLKRVKNERMEAWLLAELKRAYRKREGHKLEKIVEILASFSGPFVLKSLIKVYEHYHEFRVKLTALSAMGTQRNEKAVKYLAGVCMREDSFAYFGALALSRALHSERQWKYIEEIIDSSSHHKDLMIQVFLRLILCLPKEYVISEKMHSLIPEWTLSENPKVRYLGTRCMLRIEGHDCFLRLLEVANDDSNLEVRMAAVTCLNQIIKEAPLDLMKVLLTFYSGKIGFGLTYKLFKEAQLGSGDLKKIIQTVLISFSEALAPEDRGGAGRQGAIQQGALFLILKSLVSNQRAFLLEILEGESWSDSELCTLLRVLNQTDIHQYYGLRIHFLAKLYEEGSLAVRIELLLFFRKAYVRDVAIEDLIFRQMAIEEDPFMRAQIDNVITTWLKAKSYYLVSAVDG